MYKRGTFIKKEINKNKPNTNNDFNKSLLNFIF